MLTDEKVAKVHKRLFGNFTYKTDKAQFGELEKWVAPPDTFGLSSKLVGDCEDYAMAARKLLADEGLESSLVICNTEMGEGHCICMVGDLLLDNRFQEVQTLRQLNDKGYKFLAVNERDDKGVLQWYSVATKEV